MQGKDGWNLVKKIPTRMRSRKSIRLPLVRQMRLFVDSNDIIRSGGRIHINALLSDVTRFPYLLHRRHLLIRLVVLDAHFNQLSYKCYFNPGKREVLDSGYKTMC